MKRFVEYIGLPHNVKYCKKILYSYWYLQMLITVKTCTYQLSIVVVMRPYPWPPAPSAHEGGVNLAATNYIDLHLSKIYGHIMLENTTG